MSRRLETTALRILSITAINEDYIRARIATGSELVRQTFPGIKTKNARARAHAPYPRNAETSCKFNVR